MRVRSVVVALLMFLVAMPAGAYAAAPPLSERTVVNVTVESGATDQFTLEPTPGVSEYYWGPVTNVKHNGSNSLWVAGKAYPSGAASGKFPTYPAKTAGSAFLYLTQLDDYYSSRLSFWYLCPSRGGADSDAFALTTLNHSPNELIKRYPLGNVSAWTPKTYDLSTLANGQVSRKEIDVQFRFWDSAEGPYHSPNGQGPAIDDCVVSAYKYGPVRMLAVGQSGNDVHLSWERPYRSLTEQTEEEREISYRVWRSESGANSWTELTTARLGDAVTTFDDPITTEGVGYEYYVQAWDPGTGVNYGRAIKSGFVGAPAANPTITMTSPTNSFPLDAGAVALTGSASDSGSGVSKVEIKVQRADGRYWNGSAWTATQTWLMADPAAPGDWSTWSKSWSPDADVQASNQVVTVTARATDGTGRTASASSYSAGTISPASVAISRTRAVVAYKGTSSISGTVVGIDGPIGEQPVQLQHYSGGWKWKATKSTDGNGKVYFDVAPLDKTWYRLVFSASGYQTQVTSAVSVTPKVYLSTPKRSTSNVRKNRTFKAYGYIKPKHAYGSTPVIIKAYRYQKGKWVLRRTYKAKAYTVNSYTSKYVAKVKLPYTGKWRLRAVAPGDSKHSETWGSMSKSFRVR